jgi:hypothetical protein
LYIKPNAIEKSSSINEDIQCGSYEGNYWSDYSYMKCEKYDYIINMHHGASKEKES